MFAFCQKFLVVWIYSYLFCECVLCGVNIKILFFLVTQKQLMLNLSKISLVIIGLDPWET